MDTSQFKWCNNRNLGKRRLDCESEMLGSLDLHFQIHIFTHVVCAGSSLLAGLVSRSPLWSVVAVDPVRPLQHWLTIPSGVLMLVSYEFSFAAIYSSS